MQIKEKINAFLSRRSKLDVFLIKAGGLILFYYLIRIVVKFSPFVRPVFLVVRKLLTKFIINASYFILDVLGYDVNVHNKIIWIGSSEGVKVINACLGWSMMALFIGFIVIYPGSRKSKYWFIPVGLVAITFANVIRITAMLLVSYHKYGLLDFYHKYVFNIILYLVIFILWIYWVKRYGLKDVEFSRRD
jgi:exosortase/archaeosortase family protein